MHRYACLTEPCKRLKSEFYKTKNKGRSSSQHFLIHMFTKPMKLFHIQNKFFSKIIQIIFNTNTKILASDLSNSSVIAESNLHKKKSMLKLLLSTSSGFSHSLYVETSLQPGISSLRMSTKLGQILRSLLSNDLNYRQIKLHCFMINKDGDKQISCWM